MPWRGRRDPYVIWVSEIMLQQTQVVTVAPYFRRFLKTFPDVQALARAPIERVLKVWEGLGYYSRARNLHRAAKLIVSRYDGRLPKTVSELLTLPGIGRYTAGAIASIAFGLDEPVLDGNVARVLCRVFLVRENPRKAGTEKKLWAIAHRLIPSGRAGQFNQALMDLGATVCVARQPRCLVCPLEKHCRARRAGQQDRLPVRTRAKSVPHYDVTAGVIWKQGRILIDRRKAKGLLGGLWEFPGGKRQAKESLKTCLRREVREELGIEVRVRRPLVTVNHAYSHFRITLHTFECDYVSGRPKAIGCDAWKWVRPDDLGEYPFPKANHKIIQMLLERKNGTGRKT